MRDGSFTALPSASQPPSLLLLAQPINFFSSRVLAMTIAIGPAANNTQILLHRRSCRPHTFSGRSLNCSRGWRGRPLFRHFAPYLSLRQKPREPFPHHTLLSRPLIAQARAPLASYPRRQPQKLSFSCCTPRHNPNPLGCSHRDVTLTYVIISRSYRHLLRHRPRNSFRHRRPSCRGSALPPLPILPQKRPQSTQRN